MRSKRESLPVQARQRTGLTVDDDGGSRLSQHGKPDNPVIVLRGNPADEELAS